MNLHKFHHKISIGWLIFLTVVVLAAILTIGLKPKDFYQANRVDWLTDRPGIRFEKNSIAYTDSIADLIQEHISLKRGFSVEIALKPKSFEEEGFCFIFSIHGGQDRRQFLIGQWGSSLIVMNGDDYNHRRKTKRISFKTASNVPNVQLLTVTASPESSNIYIDGRLVKSRKDLQLTIPNAETARLLLGNSVYGNHSWKGEIYGVAVYGETLSEKDVETHFKDWSKKRRFPVSTQSPPFISFLFEDNGGTLAKNHIGNENSLHIPPEMKILSPSLFSRGRPGLMLNRSIFTNQDALLNFFGFIPLGVLLAATLIRLGGGSERYSIVITLVAGFSVSLLIETVQAWLPDRSSDIQDLILNTAGTWIGAICCKCFTRAGTEY